MVVATEETVCRNERILHNRKNDLRSIGAGYNTPLNYRILKHNNFLNVLLKR